MHYLMIDWLIFFCFLIICWDRAGCHSNLSLANASLSSIYFLTLLDYKEPSQQRGSILELSRIWIDFVPYRWPINTGYKRHWSTLETKWKVWWWRLGCYYYLVDTNFTKSCLHQYIISDDLWSRSCRSGQILTKKKAPNLSRIIPLFFFFFFFIFIANFHATPRSLFSPFLLFFIFLFYVICTDRRIASAPSLPEISRAEFKRHGSRLGTNTQGLELRASHV